ncbi:MAG: hypothetical protein COW63_02680 [Bacteroidetes bacterium CG18_big_fil_WC_8_21_14_2_50_41_14]|nr:MAG: hypothetical protein COW63_02680 [Bacteroidetes bacterium CG18_big_fil_WC_8_21_14_2_50_41_14]PIY34176.1 MAG: hypothetical protein COZ08_03315 [Bacteroidetes bacterium CG_4_10_14_3_um_filter_42_6]
MKKPIILLTVFLIAINTTNLKSQNSYVKFMAFPAVIYNYASLSYEYGINNKHSIGLQATGSIFSDEMGSSSSASYSKGIFVYYRYYPTFKTRKKIALFAELESGYFEKKDGVYSNTNISTSFLLGGRRYFGTSEHVFLDAALGVDLSYRMFHGDNQWHYDNSYSTWFYAPNEPDRFVIIPRVIVEIGYKF